MNNRSKYLFKNVGILTVSNFSSKILVFFLVPLYTSVLSTAEYGSYDLVVSSVQLLFPILTVNISDAVMRYSMDNDYSPVDVAGIGFEYILRSILIVFAITCIICHFKIFNYFNGYEAWVFLYYVSYALNQFFIQLAKGMEQVKIMALSGVIGTLVMVVSNLIFLLVFKMGLKGFYCANILAQCVPAIFSFIALQAWKVFKKNPNKRCVTNEMIKYSAPLIFSTIGWWANNCADKYIVAFMCGVTANGIISVAYKIPQVLNVIQSIFTQAWQISAIKEYNSDDAKIFYGNAFIFVNIGICLCCSILIMLNRILAGFLYANDFYIAWKYVPFLLISAVLNSAAGFLGPILSAEKNSTAMANSAIFGTCINIGLNFILIYFIGMQGATIATAASSFVIFYVRYWATKSQIVIIDSWRVFVTWISLCVQAIIAVFINPVWMQVAILIGITAINRKTIIKICKKGTFLLSKCL